MEVEPLSAIHENDTSVFRIGSKDVPDWMKEIIQYKKTGILIEDPIKIRKLKLKSL